MCGIIGCTGMENCANVLINGLKKLEYRGYDSAGIAVENGGEINVYKTVGRVDDLIFGIGDVDSVSGDCGIAHSRWATHGKPTYQNAHPHITKRFALVHNGIIENSEELKEKYLNGQKLDGDTDSEVVVRLIQHFTECGEDVERSVRRLIAELEGSYAIIIADKLNSGKLYALKNRSPLLIGIGMNYNIIGSDIMAMAEHTNIFSELHDLEYAVIDRNEVSIYNYLGESVLRDSFSTQLSAYDTSKGDYKHYMLKEIEEQPEVIRRIMLKYTDENGNLKFSNDMIRVLRNCGKICIVGCGTSYNAGLSGASFFERYANKPSDAFVASEFIFSDTQLYNNPLFIFISQSGETADCKYVLDVAKKNNYPTIAITNNDNSYISRNSDYSLSLQAGIEVAVASTKTYTAEVALMLLMSAAMSDNFGFNAGHELDRVIKAVEHMCTQKHLFKNIAEKYIANSRLCFYIGKGFDYYAGLESALKLKEISYIPAFGIPSGELKHGSIALISDGIPVISIIFDKQWLNMSLNAISEVTARGAKTICISGEYIEHVDESIVIGEISEPFSHIVSAIPSQYIAYYTALYKGCDVDKPRNLAKSVTVG